VVALPKPAPPETSRPLRHLAEDDAAFLVEAGVLLAAAQDESTVLTRLADLIVPRFADGCVFDMVEEDGTVRRALVRQSDPAREAAARTIAERYPIDPRAETNVVVRVLRTGRSSLAPEIPDEVLVASARDAEHLRLLRSLGLRSHLVVPLSVRGEMLGAVTLFTVQSDRRFGPADLALAEALARQAVIAIDGARRREAAERARRVAERAADRTAHLQAVTAALGRAITPAEVGRVIVDQGLAAFGARAGSVMLLSADGTELEMVATEGYRPEVAAALTRLPRSSPMPVPAAVRSGQAIWIPSRLAYIAAHPELAWVPTAEGDFAAAAIPLELDGRLLGGIGLSFPQPREFDDEDRAFGKALADQCAQALERARLYQVERDARDAAERERRRLDFLNEAGVRLAGSLDWEETLASVARLSVPTLADWSLVDVRMDDGTLKRVEVCCADPAKAELAAELKQRAPAPGRPVGAARAFETGETEFKAEVDDDYLRASAWDEAHLARIRRVGFRSYLGVPLVARGRILGVVSLITAESERRYGPEDVALAELLARRAALAVDNARLFREQVEARARVQALAAERARVLGQIADGVLIADPTGRITFANDAARRLHGEPWPELPLDIPTYAQTYRVRTVAGHPLSPDALPLKLALDRGETVVDAAWRLRRPDGDDRIVEGSAAPIVADDGTLHGAVLTLQDVTERRAFEEEKDAFVAIVSHDLKTPLTGVKGWAQLLKNRAERDPARAGDVPALTAIVEQAEAMRRLLDRLLETARSGAAVREPGLQRRPVDLVQLTSWLVAIHQGMTDRHALRIEGAGSREIVGCFDPDALRQILGNLLSNAIKYSPQGGPVVVTVTRNGDQARVAVRDRGIGIPATALPRLFSQYFRAENAVEATGGAPTDGQGLGLFSAQGLAARHGGRIEVESVEGGGSIFTLILPLEHCDERSST
jgi:signal transduction histidine kinase